MEHQTIRVSRTFTKEEREKQVICFGNKWVKYADIDRAILIYKDDENVAVVTSDWNSYSTNKFVHAEELYQLLIDLLCDDGTLLEPFERVLGTRKIILSPAFHTQGTWLQFNPVQKSIFFISDVHETKNGKETTRQQIVSSYCIVDGMTDFIWFLAKDVSCVQHAVLAAGPDTEASKTVPETSEAPKTVPEASEDQKFQSFLTKTLDKVYKDAEKQNEGWVEVDLNALKRSMTTEDHRVVKKMKTQLKALREAEEEEEESDESIGDDSDDE